MATATAFACAPPLRPLACRLVFTAGYYSRPCKFSVPQVSRSRPHRTFPKRSSAYASAAASDVKVGKSEKEDAYIPDPFADGRGGAICPDADWVPSRVTGAAKIASSRNVDVPNVSRCYGMILGTQMLDLGIEDLIPECIIDGIYLGWQELDSPMDVSRFESLLQSMMGQNESQETNSSPPRTMREMLALSQMYGFLLGTTLRMSCLELDLELVAAGFRTRCAEPELRMPLDESEYDRMFMEIQQIAAALMHDVNKEDADRFFASAIAAADMQRINNRVIYLEGRFKADTIRPAAAVEDTVLVVMSGRLLDGRAFLVPTFSDGLDKEADSVSIPLAGVHESLSCGIIGMRPGEVRTIYIHPSGTDGVSALFSAQPFPPQSVIAFDIKLLSVAPTEMAPKLDDSVHE
jgi:FKBP-type peptidyl-prolyl cis-trans isomerase